MVQIQGEMANVKGITVEEDDLISGLTAEEIAEFNVELNDDDNDLLPAGYRAPDQTSKEGTGEFDRDHLMQYLKEEAIQSDIVDPNFVPFEKKTRGTVFKTKEKKKGATPLLPDDLSDVLDAASEDDLLELAAVLGIHGMLTQKQSTTADSDKSWESLKGSGLRKYKGGITAATKTKQYADVNAINELDLHDALKKLKEGDESLTELNLNNHKDVTEEILLEVIENMKGNTVIKSLYLANTQMKDPICKELAEALKSNSTLEVLNLESNYIKAGGIKAILQMVETNEKLRELKLANQYNKLGHQVEASISKSLAKNSSLLRFGYNFESRGPRHSSNKYIMKNNDLDRQKRQDAKQLANGTS